jgi:hypothetical protein
MGKERNITQLTHPDYQTMATHREKWRAVHEGGHPFVDEYLVKFSTREESTDFESRKEISYSPSFAKAAVLEVVKSIYQRMPEITRKGGPANYQHAVAGKNGGVNRTGASMNLFIGGRVLPELCMQAKVGIYVDKAPQDENISRAEANSIPYLYYYTAESIRTWAEDPDTGQPIAVLLKENTWDEDAATGLIKGRIEQYRLLILKADGVHVTFYDKDGKEKTEKSQILRLKRLPIVIPELNQSLYTDIADHQIALLNLASSDLMYALKSNFPFYTEQYNPMADAAHLRPEATDGDEAGANTSEDKKIKVGTSQGRRYPMDLDRPAFIHPSAEPLTASMEKQLQIKKEIRQLIALSLSNVEARHAGIDSKRHDDLGLEAGLSYIGLETEWAEQQIQEIWAEYEGATKNDLYISYPRNYSLKTEEDRRTEADQLTKLMSKLPSETYQKETAKQVATTLHVAKVDEEILNKMHKEIDASDVVVVDPEVIKEDHDAGFVSTETASQLRGYEKGEVAKAKVDHQERLARIAAAQQPGIGAARGIKDTEADPDAAKKEKKESQAPDIQETGRKAVRGEA